MSRLFVKGRYVHIPRYDWVFKKNKILRVVLRPSIMYWRYAYMMEITYAKQWSESSMVGTTHFMLPITDHHDTKDYVLKLRDRETVQYWHRAWEEIDVHVRNKT